MDVSAGAGTVTVAATSSSGTPSKTLPLIAMIGCGGLATVVYFKAGPGELRDIAFLAIAGIAVGAAVPLARAWVKANAPRQGFLLTFIGVPLLFGIVVAITFT